MAREISDWVTNQSVAINVMGGEFTLIPNYPDIVWALVKNRHVIYIVTNGGWITSDKETERFVELIRRLAERPERKCSGSKFIVGVSVDEFHVDYGTAVCDVLRNENVTLVVGTHAGNILPVGRAWDNGINIEKPTTSCDDGPSMTVTEDGMLHYCIFGNTPYKMFHEVTYEQAKRAVFEWRAKRVIEGMTCQDCMFKLDAKTSTSVSCSTIRG